MKRNLKRLTALFLALSMTLSLLSATAWAAETDEDGSVTTGDSDLELEGTDDVGNLIVSALSETEEEQTAEENYICDVEVEGTTATVTYNISEASVEADVVVAIYDESTQQMLASGTTTVSSDDSSCTVTIEGTIPTYFLVTAYLLEADTHQPLSSEYTSQLYTQEMQEFLAKTTDDFEEEQVLNLDDDDTTNFLVYSEGTVVVDESSSAATVTDNGDGTYTVTNADETFTGLQAGDTFSYTYEDGTVLIVKVKSVVVDGDTVTITEDEDADLSDVFDYVKIEANGDNSTPSVDTSEAADGVTYLGATVSAAAIDKESSYSNKVSWSVGDETDSETFKLGVKGTVSFGYTINVKLYIATSYQYASVKLDLKLEGDVTLTGTLDLVDIALGEIDIPLTVGVYAKLKLSFEVEFSASITFHFEVSAAVGAYYDSNESGIHSLCSSPSASYQTTFKGTVYIGLKLDGYVTLIDEHLSKVGLSGTAGAEVTMKEEVISSSSGSKVHTCSDCYAGTVTGKFSISAGVDLLSGKVTATATIWSYSNKLFDLYYSVDHDEWGFTTCPYISYLCTVTVTDEDGNPVSGAIVTCSGLEEDLETDENGIVSFYLPNGSYTLIAGKGTLQKTTNFTVYNNKKALTAAMWDTHIDGGTEDPGTGDDEEDEDGDSSESEEEVTTVASGTCGDDLTWVLDSNGTLTITGTGKMTNWGTSNAPWYSYRTSIISATIESSVTSIGNYAFYYCTKLTSVTIPDSVTTIGYDAFYHCSSLTSVAIPDSVTFIDSYTFYYCASLTSVAIPDSVTAIDNYAFYYCTSLTSVTIPDSVTEIGNDAFYNCKSLTSVTIPDSVASIGKYAFYGCKSLTSVTIGSSVASIGSHAFYGCTNLTNMTIPSSVISIGSGAFYNCTSLINIIVDSENATYSSLDGVLFDKDLAVLLTCPAGKVGIYTIPDGVTSIGSSAFRNCTSLTSVSIPDSVTSIGDHAFGSCTSLTSVTIPDGVTSINDYAFYGCTSLTSVTIPDGVTSINDYAFYGCTSLTSVTIPDGVTSIGTCAFYNCTSLTSVSIPDSVTSIGTYAFDGCTGLTSVTIPDGVTSINDYAFYGCTSLTSVTIPDGVTSIGDSVFRSCTSLTSMTIPDSVASIGKYAFYGCTSLTDVYYTGSEDDWAAISIDSGNTYLTSATIHYNYDATVSAAAVDESSESVTAAEAEPETEVETESEPETETGDKSEPEAEVETEPEAEPETEDETEAEPEVDAETESEVETETETGDESEPSATETTAAGSDLSLDYLLSGGGAVVPLMAYTGSTTSADSSQTAAFTGLVSGEAYVLLVVKDAEAESLLAADNLLYIAQASADDSGSVTFTYIPRETVDGAVSYAYGTSSQNLADAEITLEAESFGYTGGAIKPLATVVYNGVTLEDGVDYTMSYSDNTEVGTATATIRGRGDYAGTISKTFTIVKGDQTVTASVNSPNILVGKTTQITATAQGALTYESSDTSVATVDENGLIAGLSLGTATITITAAGTDNYNSATATVAITVTDVLDLSVCTIEVADATYTGSELTPVVTVTDADGNALTEGTDYTVDCEGNIVAAGSYTVTVTGAGDYTGTVSKTFTVAPASISGYAVTAADATYTGSAQTPAVTVKDADGNTLDSGNYSVAYSNNTNAGTSTVTVTGTGNYTGEATTNFTIARASISGYTVTVANATYTGKAQTPTVTVKNGSTTLASGTDYTVKYTNNTNAGTATVTVTGKGNYTGTATGTFTIAKASQTVTASAAASSIYAGKTTTVTGKGTGTITYSSSNTSVATVSSKGVVTGKKPGTVTITVKAAGNGNYNAGTKTVKITVKLNKTTISSLTNTAKGVTVKWSKVTGASGYYVYRNGKQVKKITSGSTVSYTDTGAKTNGTKYQYKIYAYYGSTKSAVSSTKTIYYVSTPTISSLKNSASKKMTVQWGKNTKATGYQIQYSTSSSFSSGNKTVTVSGAKNVSKTISSLTKGKKYYVRVRAYKTVSGTKYYSAWSSTKNVKISK